MTISALASLVYKIHRHVIMAVLMQNKFFLEIMMQLYQVGGAFIFLIYFLINRHVAINVVYL